MKTTLLFAFMAIVALTMPSCKKEKTGNLSFYSNDFGKDISVTLNNGKTENVDGDYPYASSPVCGALGVGAFKNLPYGEYSYVATTADGDYWSGNVTVNECCVTQCLARSNGGGGGPIDPPTPPTAGDGQVTFWTENFHFKNTTVTINGQSDVITGVRADWPDMCGAVACATFTLAPGTYTYHAESPDHSAVWEDQLTVEGDDCTLVWITDGSGKTDLKQQVSGKHITSFSHK